MVEFDYDERGDALALYKKGEKVKYSVEVLGNYIIDINFDGNVAGLEILNASSVLNVDKSALKSIKKAELSAHDSKGGLKKLVFFLQLKNAEITSQVLVPLTAA